MKVVLIAEESAGVQALNLLAESGCRVVSVMTSVPTRRPAILRGTTVATAAARLGYPVWPATLVRDAALGRRLREAEVDLILNVHSLYIIHPEVIAAARVGSFNLHPGPLPQYAGLNAPSWAILRGEERHAVTLHWMEPGIDTGAVAYTASFALSETDTGLSVSSKCVTLGLPLIARFLETGVRDPASIPAHPQDLRWRRYFSAAVPFGGKLSWLLGARTLTRFVRACDYHPLPSPWGYPLTRLGDKEVAVMKAKRTYKACAEPPGTLGQQVGRAAEVAAADEWVLLERVRVEGKTRRGNALPAMGSRFEV